MQHILRRLITALFHCFEKQQIAIVASEMEKVIISINVDPVLYERFVLTRKGFKSAELSFQQIVL